MVDVLDRHQGHQEESIIVQDGHGHRGGAIIKNHCLNIEGHQSGQKTVFNGEKCPECGLTLKGQGIKGKILC